MTPRRAPQRQSPPRPVHPATGPVDRVADAPPLAAHRALTHPLWLVALALLVVNDHLLKGAELLPVAVTGKLSDFAGLLVAPVVVCAALLVRSRAAIAAVHLLVAAVFAGINVSPAFAAAFEGLMAWTLIPWSIYVDPSDLVALPMLWVSWAMLVPAMERRATSPVFVRSLALGVGALACMATSPPPGPGPDPGPPGEFVPWIQGNLGVANDGDEAVVLRVRHLKDSVWLDCGLVLANPQHALSRELFGPAEVWIVDPGRVSPIASRREWSGGERCDAFLVDGTDLAMRVLAVDLDVLFSTEFPSTAADADAARTIHVGASEGGWGEHAAVHPAPGLVEPLAAPGCELADEADSLAWSELPAQGWWTLDGVTVAPDGCVALDLRAGSAATRWFLCVPAGAFPFDVGEEILISPLLLGHSLQPIEGVELATDAERLRLARGEDAVVFGPQTMELRQNTDCALSHDACGDLVRPLELVVDLGAVMPSTLRTGERLELGVGEALYLVRAMDIPLGDADCLPDDLTSTRLVETVFVRSAPDSPPSQDPVAEDESSDADPQE